MKKQNILVFCAHPDDEIIGMGGTIAKYAQEGHDVYVVILTYGEAANPWFKKKVSIKTRVSESKAADSIVKAKKTIFLALPDGKLNQELKPSNIDKVTSIIRRYKPSRIFTHSLDDIMFPDHRATYELVSKALDNIKFVCELYCFNIWNPINLGKGRCPKLFVDVTQTFNLKIEALHKFKSQKWVYAQLIPAIYIRAIKNGLKNECRFAEKFYKLR